MQVVATVETSTQMFEPQNATATLVEDPSLQAARFIVLHDGGNEEDKVAVHIKEREVKATLFSVSSFISTCRIPTMCANQTEGPGDAPPECEQACSSNVADKSK